MRQPTSQQDPQQASRRDVLVAFACGGLVASMIGLSFAAVPLCSWLCGGAGRGGTAPAAYSAPAQNSDRPITGRFASNGGASNVGASNVGAGLPWQCAPARRTIKVKPGEVAGVSCAATNDGLDLITLSYTFHAVRRPERPVAESATPGTSGGI